MSFVPHMPCEWCERKDAEINRYAVRMFELQSKLDRIRQFADAQNMIALPGNPMDEGYRAAIEQLKELLE